MSADRPSVKTGSSLLLDSCIVIAHFRRNEEVGRMLHEAEGLFLPLAAYGELYYGALKAANSQKRLEELNTFFQIVTLCTPNQYTAQIYGDIRLDLALNGKPIPENDIWIAATAKQYTLPLLTHDQHFKSIKDLNLLLV